MIKYLPDITVFVSFCNNNALRLERCIRSLSHQNGLSDTEYEMIIIGDTISDFAIEMIDNLSVLNNLKRITRYTNHNHPVTLNDAINHSLGRYIVQVNSDDYVRRNFLLIMKMFLDANRHYQAVAMDYLQVDDYEKQICVANSFEEPIPYGIMYRKECLQEIVESQSAYELYQGSLVRNHFEKHYKVGRLEFPFYLYRSEQECSIL